MAAASDETIAPSPAARIGLSVRRLRLRQRRTLQDVANACGFTRSLLSKIENGRTVPPVATLSRIAEALGVRISTLLESDVSASAVVDSAADTLARTPVRTERGYAFLALAESRASKLMQPFIFIARRGEVRRHVLSHAGEEFIHVLKGRMRYRVGATEYRLGPGDSLYFDSEAEHAIEPLTAEVRYLGVFAEPARPADDGRK
jgi:transcriptional regulator with XRE-family HTH domain